MKSKGRLTDKQEKFIEALISGKSQREAYREAYGCKGWKDRSIDIKASQLFKSDKVQLRYSELHDDAVKQSGHTAAEVRALIMKQLYGITSGDICKEDYVYDVEGNTEVLTSHRKTRDPATIRSAADDLAMWYGIKPTQQIDSSITIKYKDDEEDFAG